MMSGVDTSNHTSLSAEPEAFRIIPGCTYELRGHPDQRKVAHIYQVGIDKTEGVESAFGVIVQLTSNGIVYEACDWRIGGTFYPVDGMSGLDIVSAIGAHAPADQCAMVPLYGASGFKTRLQAIVDLSRALRQGGASPEDLGGLDDALNQAVEMADDLLSDLVWSPPVTGPAPDIIKER